MDLLRPEQLNHVEFSPLHLGLSSPVDFPMTPSSSPSPHSTTELPLDDISFVNRVTARNGILGGLATEVQAADFYCLDCSRLHAAIK